jgi:hypothetical protein
MSHENCLLLVSQFTSLQFSRPHLYLKKTKIYTIFIFGIKLISEFPTFHLTIFHFDVIKQHGPNITELFEFICLARKLEFF